MLAENIKIVFGWNKVNSAALFELELEKAAPLNSTLWKIEDFFFFFLSYFSHNPFMKTQKLKLDLKYFFPTYTYAFLLLILMQK